MLNLSLELFVLGLYLCMVRLCFQDLLLPRGRLALSLLQLLQEICLHGLGFGPGLVEAAIRLLQLFRGLLICLCLGSLHRRKLLHVRLSLSPKRSASLLQLCHRGLQFLILLGHRRGFGLQLCSHLLSICPDPFQLRPRGLLTGCQLLPELFCGFLLLPQGCLESFHFEAHLFIALRPLLGQAVNLSLELHVLGLHLCMLRLRFRDFLLPRGCLALGLRQLLQKICLRGLSLCQGLLDSAIGLLQLCGLLVCLCLCSLHRRELPRLSLSLCTKGSAGLLKLYHGGLQFLVLLGHRRGFGLQLCSHLLPICLDPFQLRLRGLEGRVLPCRRRRLGLQVYDNLLTGRQFLPELFCGFLLLPQRCLESFHFEAHLFVALQPLLQLGPSGLLGRQRVRLVFSLRAQGRPLLPQPSHSGLLRLQLLRQGHRPSGGSLVIESELLSGLAQRLLCGVQLLLRQLQLDFGLRLLG
mmetsp:Transcript_38539/g.89183  ORF Transcript_38539/g.89183 Transcript_38539/m.89183 type:complete len:467 (-) Transcript_38539:616-2016(-)